MLAPAPSLQVSESCTIVNMVVIQPDIIGFVVLNLITLRIVRTRDCAEALQLVMNYKEGAQSSSDK